MKPCTNCGLNTAFVPMLQPYLDLAVKLESNCFRVEDNQYDAVQATLKAARADASALQLALDRIQRLCSAATRTIPIIAKSLAPVRRLPNEVLVHIFQRFAPCAENDWDPIHLWGLSHVCARWRNIVLNTPRLWSTIAYTCSPAHLTNSSRLAMQMQLSRSQPLHVIIRDYRPSPNEYRTLLGAFTNVLWLHFFRITSATITTFAETLPLIFSPSNTICTFSSLTHLTLTLHETETVSNARGLFLTNKETPSLTHVTLCSFITGHVSLPWAQLKTLSFIKSSLIKVMPILPLLSMQKLEEMKLDITFENVDTPESAISFISFRIPDILHFPNLRKLTTRFNWIWRPAASFEIQQALLSRFRLPALLSWTTYKLVLDSSRPLNLGITSPSTHHLDLDDLLFTDLAEAEAAIVSLLDTFSSATILRFAHSTLDPMSDLIFNVFLNHPGCCPDLQQLDIEDLEGAFAYRPADFVQFLQERKRCSLSWLGMGSLPGLRATRNVMFGPDVEESDMRAESLRRYGHVHAVKCFRDLSLECMTEETLSVTDCETLEE